MKGFFKAMIGPLLLFIIVECQAQSVNKEIKIGSICPDINIGNIINYSKATAHISDFKGKLLILDFWATWCSPCVALMKNADSLEKEFDGKIQVMPVTYESKLQVQDFLARLAKAKHFLPPTVTDDTILQAYFKHNVLPHLVWIDANSTVIAITEGNELTAININKALAGTLGALPVKKDMEEPVVKMEGRPYTLSAIAVNANNSTHLKALDDAELLVHSVLTHYVDELGVGGTSTRESYVSVWNNTIKWLYRVALWHHGVEILNESKTVVDIPDDAVLSNKIAGKDAKGNRMSGDAYLSSLKNGNGYCYELQVPDSLADEKFDIMLTDLNQYFGRVCGIEGVIENRKVTYLALTTIASTNKLIATGTTTSVKSSLVYFKMENNYLFQLISALRMPLQMFPFIEDETNFSGKSDIELNCNLSDLNAVNVELDKYGLKLEKKEKIMPIAVIRKKHLKM
jgi:thiol-disulfide isomerase/thioredoxin